MLAVLRAILFLCRCLLPFERGRVVQVSTAPLQVGQEKSAAEEPELGDDLVAAEDPIGEEDVVWLVVPGVV